ncbi:hypothetical protein Tco_0594290 [Tanacetum coccineum]
MRQHRRYRAPKDYIAKFDITRKANGVRHSFELKGKNNRCSKSLVMTMAWTFRHKSLRSKEALGIGENLEAEDIRADKMYHDMKMLYWWPNRRLTSPAYVKPMPTCAKVQKLNIKDPQVYWSKPRVYQNGSWETITMDFHTKLPKWPAGFDSIWVIVDRLTNSDALFAMRRDKIRP